MHSSQWKASKEVKKKIKEEKKIKEIKDDENKFYQELKDNEEIEKVFGKIKEIKKINMERNISFLILKKICGKSRYDVG